MITVVSLFHHRTTIMLSKQAIAASIIPAAWALAEVAPDRSHHLDLRTSHAIRSLYQSRVVLFDVVVVQQLIQSDQGTDSEATPLRANALQLLDVFNVNDTTRSNDPILHQAQEVCAASQDDRIVSGTESLDGLFSGRWAGVFECFHHQLNSPFSIASRTRSGVRGR